MQRAGSGKQDFSRHPDQLYLRTKIVRTLLGRHTIGAKIRHLHLQDVAECTLSRQISGWHVFCIRAQGFLVVFLITVLGEGYVDVGK
jgi:hypothetical protein